MRNLLLFTLFLFAFLAKPIVCLADGENPPKPIILDEKPIKDPTKIKSPSLLRLSAYVDGNAVVITSTADILAHVIILDLTSGQTFYNNTVSMAPQCRCQIAHTEAVLTLQIKVDDKTYEGNFHL